MTAQRRVRRRLVPPSAIAAAGWLAIGATSGAMPARGQANAPPAPSREAPAPAVPAQGYTYNPEGRRDPFVSLIDRGSADAKAGASSRPDGLAGLFVGDIAIRGIILSRGAYAALIQAPDNKTYTIRPGETLFDASVKAVTADAVVFVQQVTDPLSLVKQREIRKPLRPIEEGK